MDLTKQLDILVFQLLREFWISDPVVLVHILDQVSWLWDQDNDQVIKTLVFPTWIYFHHFWRIKECHELVYHLFLSVEFNLHRWCEWLYPIQTYNDQHALCFCLFLPRGYLFCDKLANSIFLYKFIKNTLLSNLWTCHIVSLMAFLHTITEI